MTFFSNGIPTLAAVGVGYQWVRVKLMKEVQMHWRKYAYSLVGLYIVFDIILVAAMKEQGPTNPHSWESILGEFGLAVAIMFVGLDAVLSPKGLLDWLRKCKCLRRYHPANWALRLLGCLWLLGGGILLVSNVENVLLVLGVISSP